MQQKILMCAALAAATILGSCNTNETVSSQDEQLGPQSSYNGKAPKYIFYFIGDGMSQPQISMAEKAFANEDFVEQFNKQTCGIYNAQKGQKLYLKQFKNTGMATTFAQNRYITGSAAAATALSTGNKTTINTISMNGERTEAMKTVAEMARDNGMKVGVISSVSIDHATPACFYAHVPDRNMYEEIDKWLLKSGYDFFGGGNVRWDTYDEDMTKDQFFDSLKTMGYTIASTVSEFNAVNSSTKKAFCTIAKNMEDVHEASTLPYNIDLDIQTSDDDRIVLRDFVKKAIEVLYNEDKGFFLMTEGGKIDWTDHANDAVANVYETLALDQAIGVALDFYKQHPDETLIVFTGDHECGGLTLGYAGTEYESAFQLMSKQSISYYEFSAQNKEFFSTKPTFEQTLQRVYENFGIGGDAAPLKLSDYETKRLKDAYNTIMKNGESNLTDEEKHLYYAYYDPITVTTTHILDNKSGVDWASFAHTALPVPVYSMGCGSNLLVGYFDNTDIPKTIMKVAGLK